MTVDPKIVTRFVDRNSLYRKPGVVLNFLSQFVENQAAQKIVKDAESTFADYTEADLLGLKSVIEEEKAKLAEENLKNAQTQRDEYAKQLAKAADVSDAPRKRARKSK